MRLKLYSLLLICFFEKPEVKKALHALVKQFVFKNQSDSKKTVRLHTVLSKKKRICLSLKMNLVKLDWDSLTNSFQFLSLEKSWRKYEVK